MHMQMNAQFSPRHTHQSEEVTQGEAACSPVFLESFHSGDPLLSAFCQRRQRVIHQCPARLQTRAMPDQRPLAAAAWCWAGWVLVLVCLQARCARGGAITLHDIDTDVFDIYLSGVKIFQHNLTNPMMFIGDGRTDFAQSQGNFRINDFVSSRIPMIYATIFSHEAPIDIELYLDFYHYVRFELHEDDTHSMVLVVTDMKGESIDRLWLRLVASPEEQVFGGGEQFSFLDLRGRSFPVWSGEQGIGRNKSTLTTFQADQRDWAGGDYHTTYHPQPTFISTRGYSLHHEGSDFTVMDFTQPDFHEVLVLAQRNVSTGRVLIQNGSDVSSLVAHLSGYLGRQPSLPEWVHSGAILGLTGGTSKVRSQVRQAEEQGVAVCAVWIEDWAGSITTPSGPRTFWNWQWNETRYPELPQMIRDFQERGIRVLGYITPHLHQQGPMFAAAEERGYLVKNSTNQTYLSNFGHFLAGSIDLTNPEAFQWYKNDVIRRNMVDLGLSGWTADMGEHLPVDTVHYSGQSGEELHNHWPLLWSQLNRQAVEEAGKLGEVIFWMRSGFSGSGNYSTLQWAGDQNVDWSPSDGLPSTITAALSLAMSGLTLTHFDIGGFTTFASFTPPLVRSEQLLLRSAEMAVFTPVFRTHEGSQPWANVQFYSSRATLLKFARLSRMFSALQNYSRHVVSVASRTGLAAQRPLFLNYPSDPSSYHAPYHYMYGPDLLVAPVCRPDVTSRDVYLPRDPETAWVFLWDESMIVRGGMTVTVPAPLGKPPVFYRSVSPYVSVFRAVASEPLVQLPPYVPSDPEPGAGGGDGGGESGGSANGSGGGGGGVGAFSAGWVWVWVLFFFVARMLEE
ncbi:sulfoquinovosidase-like [Babylonia areolata]|uniref:sulfoquinovosidase-like n=1 Tax=Babylonia areolata TaxID=304850 RepID=UPI003FD10F47